MDLPGDEADPDHDGHQPARDLQRAQTHVEDDAVPVPHRELGDQQRSGDEQHREDQQVVEQLAADQLPHGVAGDGEDGRHSWISNRVVSP